MTTEKLLENLRNERQQLDSVIHYIERAISHKSKVQKAHDIVKSVANDSVSETPRQKHTERKKKHWTQTPEGRKRMSKIMKKSHAARKLFQGN